MILQLTLTVGLTLLGAPHGVFPVAWAVGRTYLTLPLQMWFLRRASGITAQNTFTAIAAPFFASAIMGVAVWCIMAAVRPHISVALVAVLVGVAAGIVIYSVALLALSRQIRGVVRRQFVTRILKRPAK